MRPVGMRDAEVDAPGELSDAVETVEHAHGLRCGLHRLTGKGDLALGEAVKLLRAAGRSDLADDIDRNMVGRNAIEGQSTFQVVEDYEDN